MNKNKILAIALTAGGLAGCGEAVQGQAVGESQTVSIAPVPPSATQPSTIHVPPPPSPNTVYFQPRLRDLHDSRSREIPMGVIKMVAEPGTKDSWTAGNCRPDNAANFLREYPRVSQILAFSLGRLGLDYSLQKMNPAQERDLDYALIIAPGNKEDFTDSCDRPETSRRVYEWLSDNKEARLTFIADARTAQDNHRGLRELYLDHPDITSVADQIALCTSGLGHEDAWNRFKGLVVYDRIDQPGECPQGTQWVDLPAK